MGYNRLLVSVTFVVALLPGFFYWVRWGFGLWQSHDDWSTMATYFSGFYGPILTAISISFVALQIKVQTKESKVKNLQEEFHSLLRLLTNELSKIDPKEIEEVRHEVEKSLGSLLDPCGGEKALPFIIERSQLIHSYYGISMALESLYGIDRKRYGFLRDILFATCKRDSISKLEFVSVKCLPRECKYICDENT